MISTLISIIVFLITVVIIIVLVQFIVSKVSLTEHDSDQELNNPVDELPNLATDNVKKSEDENGIADSDNDTADEVNENALFQPNMLKPTKILSTFDK